MEVWTVREYDEKIIVCKYKFLAKEGEFDKDGVESWLGFLQEQHDCHVTVYVENAFFYKDIFVDETVSEIDEDVLVVQSRIVKKLGLDQDGQRFADDVAKGFEALRGVDGSLTWFEKKEGTATYLRLLGEIKQKAKFS